MAAIQQMQSEYGQKNKLEHWQKQIGARKAKKALFGFNAIRIRVNFVQSSPFILDSELHHGICLWVQLLGEQVALSPIAFRYLLCLL